MPHMLVHGDDDGDDDDVQARLLVLGIPSTRASFL
jgi:hypothetical protein